MDVVGGLILILGAAFVLIGGIGVVRFPNVYSRMHAAAKGPTLGLLLTGIGVILTVRSTVAIVGVTLVVVLQFIAGPVGSHIIARVANSNPEPSSDQPGPDTGN